ncbi:hypothetical protein B0H66DRAFT_538676 [Apodospora peruviana]|uniref:BZIP domain-containing protein n=1 Tax=Apodospora peruviana TaxID=516989 RepID=A0AAE0HTG9_9PEZI|nr:hypothetical protein B0H66DRAFT_538676 [Apodospora peruviana]
MAAEQQQLHWAHQHTLQSHLESLRLPEQQSQHTPQSEQQLLGLLDIRHYTQPSTQDQYLVGLLEAQGYTQTQQVKELEMATSQHPQQHKQQPSARTLASRSETPDHQSPRPSSSTSDVKTNRQNDGVGVGAGGRRAGQVTLGNAGVTKRKSDGGGGAGAGGGNKAGGNTARTARASSHGHASGSSAGAGLGGGEDGSNAPRHTQRVQITEDMTPDQKARAEEHNKTVDAWIDDRVRNNQSAKRSRLKKMMYIVDMDNTIKEYQRNVIEFKQAYDLCMDIISKHNLQAEMAFIPPPILWERPEVPREQEIDVAEHRAKLEREVEGGNLVHLGLGFAEKVARLVNRFTGPANDDEIARALEEHRRKAEEYERKEAQYQAQMQEHERKLDEIKDKIREVQKQQADCRAAAEKFQGRGQVEDKGKGRAEDAMMDAAMPLVPSQGQTPAGGVPFLVYPGQGQQPQYSAWVPVPGGPPLPQQQGAQLVPTQIQHDSLPQVGNDFLDRGKMERDDSMPVVTLGEEGVIPCDFDRDIDEWRKSQEVESKRSEGQESTANVQKNPNQLQPQLFGTPAGYYDHAQSTMARDSVFLERSPTVVSDAVLYTPGNEASSNNFGAPLQPIYRDAPFPPTTTQGWPGHLCEHCPSPGIVGGGPNGQVTVAAWQAQPQEQRAGME